MSKLILSAALLAMLAGCKANGGEYNSGEYNNTYVVSTPKNSLSNIQMVSLDQSSLWCNLILFCDVSTDIAYVHLRCGNRSGFTAYLNVDGKPYKCKELK